LVWHHEATQKKIRAIHLGEVSAVSVTPFSFTVIEKAEDMQRHSSTISWFPKKADREQATRRYLVSSKVLSTARPKQDLLFQFGFEIDET
jgi:hypothetical protein